MTCRGNGSALPPIMAIIGGIWSDTAIAGYMGFAAICGGKAEPLPLRRGWNRVRFARRGWI